MSSPYYCSFVSEEFIICECGDNFPNEEELLVHIANNHEKTIKSEDVSEDAYSEGKSDNEQTFNEQDVKNEYIISDYCIEEPIKLETEVIKNKLVSHRNQAQPNVAKITSNKPSLVFNQFGVNSGNVIKNLTNLKTSPMKFKNTSPNKITNIKKINIPSSTKKLPNLISSDLSSNYKLIKLKKGDIISKEWLTSQLMKVQSSKERIPTIQLTKAQLQNLHIRNKPVIKLDTPLPTKVIPMSTKITPISAKVTPISAKVTSISTKAASISTKVTPTFTKVSPVFTKVKPTKLKIDTKKGNPINLKKNTNTKQNIDTNKNCIYTILQKNPETMIFDSKGHRYEIIETKQEIIDENDEIIEESYDGFIEENNEEINEIIEENNEMVEIEVPSGNEQAEELVTEEQKEYIIYDENGIELRREFLTDEEAANYNLTYEDVAMETETESYQVDEAYVNETELATETIIPDTTLEESYEWQCELCGEKFVKRRQYTTHYRRVHEEGLILEKLLKKNKKTNAKQTIYAVICETCGKRCGSKVLLKYHQTVHTGEKPYPCKECDKAFSTPMLLQIHVRVHTGETPYHCSQCPKAFKNKAALNRHDRVHTGVKPYACPECGKCFTQSNSMKLHVRTVHMKLPAPYKRKPRNKDMQEAVVEEVY